MPEIIRLGDPTSHGGKVLEGSVADICHGKSIAYIGNKVSCPLCKGTYPIVEGVNTTTFYGKGVAVAGMKTACGATLIATQFTDTVEWSSGGSAESQARAAKAAPARTTPVGVSETPASNIAAAERKNQEPYDEQPQLPARISEGVPFLIITPDGQRFSGKVDQGGTLPRIATEGEIDYSVYWGDEALARMEG